MIRVLKSIFVDDGKYHCAPLRVARQRPNLRSRYINNTIVTSGCQGTRENHVQLSHVAVLHHVPRQSFSGSMSKQTAVQPSSSLLDQLVHSNTVYILLKTATLCSFSDVIIAHILSIKVLNVLKRVGTPFKLVFYFSFENITHLVRKLNKFLM